MTVDSFSGTWIFDPSASNLTSSPREWQQIIRVEGDNVSVREEIDRDSGRSVVEVLAAFDGGFYEVKGSPFVDEIAYTFESERIQGTGRKQGVVVLREIVTLLGPDTLSLMLTIIMGGKEIPLGSAIFRRA